MILKEIDSKDKEINTLTRLLKESTNDNQKALIKKDLDRVKNGYEKEKENAYLLNFEYKNSKNIYVIHDIRLEYKDRTAQIDHILLTRLGIEVLESKSFNGEVTIKSDNSIEVQYKTRKIAQQNPLEQSKRHELVIKDILNDECLLTNKIGQELDISSKVLFNPKTIITNDPLPSDFVRADSYVKERNKEIDNMSIINVYKSAMGLQKINSIKKIADFLISQHKPINFEYEKKYRIKKIKEVKELKEDDTCPRCNDGILVLRKRKNKKFEDKFENDTFLGCSRFPKCRYSIAQD